MTSFTQFSIINDLSFFKTFTEMNFDNKILRVKDSLPLVPEGMENWILNKIKYPKAFSTDGDLCYCGKCGNHFHTTRKIEKMLKAHIENPCQFCVRKSCEYSRLNENTEISRTDCSNYKRMPEIEVITKCPACHHNVILVITDKDHFFHRIETCALTVHEGIQLLRSYVYDFTFVKGKPMVTEIKNTCNHWISENGVVRVTRRAKDYDKDPDSPLLHLIFSHGTPNYRNILKPYEEDLDAAQKVRINLEHYISRSLYPEIKLASYIKKRGFCRLSVFQIQDLITWQQGMFNKTGNLLRFLKCLIRFPFVETLVKKGDIKMLYTLFGYNMQDVKKLISSYYVACRKGYEIIHPQKWTEMIMILDKAGKDIRNPKFICPADLDTGYNEAMSFYLKFKELEKKRQRKEYERTRPRDIYWFLEKNPVEIERCNEDPDYFYQLTEIYGGFLAFPGIRYQIQKYYDEDGYEYVYIHSNQINNIDYLNPVFRAKVKESFKRIKGHLFNLNFGNNELRLESLDSIEAYHEEGERMHNCIETGGYFMKSDSLILSVKKDGRSVADVELSLKNFEILQCLGPCNEVTPYRNKIETLIKSNITLIKSRLEMKIGA